MTWGELYAALAARQLLDLDSQPGVSDRDRTIGVTSLAYDSRLVRPGGVFVALKGQKVDGASFVADALARGAVAVVSSDRRPEQVQVPWATVRDSRLALAALAVTFAGNPSSEMRVVGVTGTNGKTTTAYLLASIFDAAGIPCGLLGTVGYRVGGVMREATMTTPEAPEVQNLLREMVDEGCRACAMEVSSHALELHRVDGMTFAAAVFTNLTRDHLDFHSDMEAYFRAKRRLFEMLPPEAPAIINADDPRGGALTEVVARTTTYAISRPADVTPGPLSYSLQGLSFDVRTPAGTVRIESPLVGRPNVYNILAAVSTAVALGLPLARVEAGVAALGGVPGRFQVVSSPKDEVMVVVDYAHTDDALRNLLETARPLTPGRLVIVFGCGGDRDRTKRPLMGAVASRLGDLIVMTSDNPRSEDPGRIIEEIQRGVTPDTRRDVEQRIVAIVDRGEAIRKAIELAGPGDLVLIAGKGHEKYQVIGKRVLPFDDVAVAREALALKRSSSGVV